LQNCDARDNSQFRDRRCPKDGQRHLNLSGVASSDRFSRIDLRQVRRMAEKAIETGDKKKGRDGPEVASQRAKPIGAAAFLHAVVVIC
jgi:hypothetical protein